MSHKPVGDYYIAYSRRGWLLLLGFVTALLIILFGDAVLRFWHWMFD